MMGIHYKIYSKYLLRVIRHYIVSNKKYRIKKFKKDFKQTPNLITPRTFNEKILYRMIHVKNEELYAKLADKLRARIYVNAIHSGILTEVYSTFNTVEEIKIDDLPEKFVLKCNHDSGSFVICTDKKKFDFKSAKKKIATHLKMNMYYKTREWQYKKIAPLIICEEYIDVSSMQFDSYKAEIYRVHCFDSKPTYIEVEYTDNSHALFANIYDENWVLLPVTLNNLNNTPIKVARPGQLTRMLKIAQLLSKNFDYIRVDLYLTAERIYFSEFTFSPNNGREVFSPNEWDAIFGGNWDISLE